MHDGLEMENSGPCLNLHSLGGTEETYEEPESD